MRLMKCALFMVIVGLCSAVRVNGQTWNGNSSTNWGVASNWTPSGVPAAGASIVIPAGLSNYPSLDANRAIGDLDIASGATLNLNGRTLTLAGSVTGTGQLFGGTSSNLVLGGVAYFSDAASHALKFASSPSKYTETFNSLDAGVSSGSIDLSSPSGFAYTVSIPSSSYYLLAPAAGDQALSTLAANDPIRFNFTGLPVYAFGGNFYLTDQNGNKASNCSFRLVLTFSDATAVSYNLSSSNNGYFGFSSGKRIQTVSMETNAIDSFNTVDNFVVGQLQANAYNLNLSQSVSGTSNALGSLTLEQAPNAVITLGAPLLISNTVTVTSGVLNANNMLTLVSNANGSASIAAHGNAGSVIGNVKVQRFIPASGRKKQWRFLGFPFTSDLLISNITGTAFDYNASTRSLMKYAESADNGAYTAGSGSARNGGYQTFTASSEAIKTMEGVAAWIYGTSGSATAGTLATAQTITSFGTLFEDGNPAVKNLSYTSANVNKGWNLVANPFASNLDWTSAGITLTNIDPTVYRWDPQAEGWTTYNRTTGVSTGGADKIVESGSSFFVLANAVAPSISFAQSAKTVTASAFSHFAKNQTGLEISVQSNTGVTSRESVLSGIRLRAGGTGNPSPGEAYVDLSRSDATPGFDRDYDAMSMSRVAGADIKVMLADKSGVAVQFDKPISEEGKDKRYYPISIAVPQTGLVQLSLQLEGQWNATNTIHLIDLKEGKTIPLSGSTLDYAFQMTSLKEEGRFLLAINHLYVPAKAIMPVGTLRILENPVVSNRLSVLVDHPTSKPAFWSVTGSNGVIVGRGKFALTDASIQHHLYVGSLSQSGVYTLSVEFTNGDRRVARFVKP